MFDGSHMAEQSPIPTDLSAAFHRAVWSFRDWGFARFEPSVSVNQNPFLMSAVCDLVIKFRDPLPSNVFDKLLSYTLEGPPSLRRDLVEDRSYATGARCLLKMVRDRNAKYQQQRAQWQASSGGTGRAPGLERAAAKRESDRKAVALNAQNGCRITDGKYRGGITTH
jgi:hypothetical protein